MSLYGITFVFKGLLLALSGKRCRKWGLILGLYHEEHLFLLITSLGAT